jgi:hypothetical protein
MRKLKYKINEFRWIKALFSPFKPFTVKLYCGKTAVGVPYFYPRKWVKATPKLATEATLEYIKKEKAWNERNPDHSRKIKPFKELYDDRMGYTFPVPLKIGFSSCGLGWKTKWDQYDVRYEYGPVLSFVFFGYQIALMIGTPNKEHVGHYWESWICYEYKSDKKKSKYKRIAFCRRKCPQTWSRGNGENKVTTDYWDLILKPKYLKQKDK